MPHRLNGAWRLRSLALVALVAFAAIAIASVVSLLWIARLSRETTDTAIRHTEGRLNATQLHASLLTYQHLGNLVVISDEPSLRAARDAAAADVRRRVELAVDYIASATEQVIVEELTLAVGSYFAERERAEAEERDLAAVVRRTRASDAQAIALAAELRDENVRQVAAAHAESVRVVAVTSIVAASTAAAALIALVALFILVPRLLLTPLLELHEGVVRYREGNRDARANAAGCRELRELGSAFNDLADELSEEKMRELAYLAGVAHDLRNPLAGLKMVVAALPKMAPSAERDRALTLMGQQLDHLARMVGDLLDAKRIEAGKLEMEAADVDLRSVASTVVQLHTRVGGSHEVVLDVPPDPVLVRGDALRFEQVLGNLLGNAIKFSPAGSRIDVAVAIDADGASMSVTDRGPGIAANQIDDSFRPFERLRAGVPGAGLGLSVAQRIMQAHGGSIDVRSAPGEGSTFTARLPRQALSMASFAARATSP